jgi:hypothetical protein
MPIYQERAQGTYRCTYTGCKDVTFTDEDTGEEQARWRWSFQEVTDPLTTGEISKFTGRSMKSPNSNAYKIAAGILGHKPAPGDDTEAHVGQLYDVWYGPNQAGNLTIVGVVRVPAEAVPVPPPAPAPSNGAAATPPAPVDMGTLPELP